MHFLIGPLLLCSFLNYFFFCIHLPKGRHGRGRMGEEESDVDIEGFEEDYDGKPKTPAPVIVYRAKKKKPMETSLLIMH